MKDARHELIDYLAGRKIYDAILARAKEVEAQPYSTDEKKI